MAGSNHQTKAFDGFPGGVNNVFREESVPDDQLRQAVNIDLLPGGKVRRRSGYLRHLELTDARSGASHLGYLYAADQGNFVRVDPVDFSAETIASVAPHAYLSYAGVNEYLYVTDGINAAFRISPAGEVTDWSPETPLGQPDVSPLALGGLPAGDYQVAMTYLRGREESGAYRATTVEIADGGGIQVSNIPTPQSAETTSIRIYMSNTNGEVLYAAKEVAPGTTGVVLSALPNGKALETQFFEPVPPGHLVRHYNGRLYSAVDNVLFYSQAMRYGLSHLTHDYIEFDARITMVRPVESGIFVAAGKRVHFFSGNDPETFERSLAHPFGVVEGTDAEVRAGMFNFEALKTGTVAVWWSTSGVMVIGLPNGQVLPVRDGELALPEFTRGATMVREYDGVQQLVSVLQQPMAPQSPLAARDEATVTVHRNGIELTGV